MDINEIYKSIAANMLSEFEHTQTQIKHMGGRGSEREAILKAFLEAYLPSRYGISSGEIMDYEGGISHQCDLIIYDHFNCPILLAGKNYRIFPAEWVLAVIEVKSVLTLKELGDSVEKIIGLKNLKRGNGPIPGILFAYKAVWKKDSIIRTAKEFQSCNVQLQGHQYIDLICVLNDGVITLDTVLDGFSIINEDISERCMLVYLDLAMSGLLWFYKNLLDLLESQNNTKSSFFDYLQPEIGVCRKYNVVSDF